MTLGWFLTLYSGVLSTRLMLRVWDLLFYEGSTVLFRIALAILKLKVGLLSLLLINQAQPEGVGAKHPCPSLGLSLP